MAQPSSRGGAGAVGGPRERTRLADVAFAARRDARLGDADRRNCTRLGAHSASRNARADGDARRNSRSSRERSGDKRMSDSIRFDSIRIK